VLANTFQCIEESLSCFFCTASLMSDEAFPVPALSIQWPVIKDVHKTERSINESLRTPHVSALNSEMSSIG
jgi:hypothetical protein